MVDDENHVREITKLVLQDHVFLFLSAASGKEAIEIAQSNKIDILITDMLMSEMNGDELSKVLLASQPHIKVLYLSGGEGNGSVNYLQKPFGIKEFLSKIKEILNIS